MDRTRWERIQTLFHDASALPEGDRQSFLSLGGDSEDVIAEVFAMLRADHREATLLDHGLSEVAHELLDNASPEFSAQQEFGPYRLLRVLGEGGMGVVWLAERRDAGNLVAIKFLPHAGLSPARRERFTQEIRTLAKLNHPFIARLYDAGTLSDGTPWFVMEYVDGVSISEFCESKHLAFADRLCLLRSVCEAVQYAHSQETIHRDLKPSNILVKTDGSPRLLDFGIARQLQNLDTTLDQTRPGLRFMSPDYAAPEWRDKGSVGFSTDVYSLGVILYQLLAGHVPKRRETAASEDLQPVISLTPPSIAAEDTHGAGAVRRPSRAEWKDLDVLCLTAVHTDPRRRYQSVEAFIRDIDHFLKSEPLEARSDTLAYRTSRFIRRHRASVLAVSAVVVVIVGLTIFFTVRLARARDAALSEASRREEIQRFMLNLLQGGDEEAGPAKDLRVVTLIDHGVQEAQFLRGQPEVQADLYQTLGAMSQKLGRLDRANELLQLSLKIREGTTTSPSAFAENLIALGFLQSEQGKYVEAEQSVRSALQDIQTHDPNNKALLARAEAALGGVLVAAGQQAQSVDVLKRAISIMESEGSDALPDLSQAIGSLADAQLYLGHYDESKALNQHALAIDSQIYGPSHPHVADDLGNLAQIQEARGYYADAERYERQALQIDTDWYGADHPETARKMTTLGGTLNFEGKFAEAQDLLRRAVAILEQAYGDSNERVAYALNALGSSQLQEKKFTEAEATYHKVIGIYQNNYGDGDYRVAVAINNLASVYQAEQRYRDAEILLVDAVARLSNALGAGNIQTGIGEVRLGRVLLHEKKYRQGAEQSRAGYETLSKQTSSQTSYVQGALHDLIVDYTALGELGHAKEFKAKLEAIDKTK